MALGGSKEYLKLVVLLSQTGQKVGAKLEKVSKKDEKVDILELDELCVIFLNIWLWTAVDRDTNRFVGFQIGTRETKHCQKLADKISYIDA